MEFMNYLTLKYYKMRNLNTYSHLLIKFFNNYLFLFRSKYFYILNQNMLIDVSITKLHVHIACIDFHNEKLNDQI